MAANAWDRADGSFDHEAWIKHAVPYCAERSMTMEQAIRWAVQVGMAAKTSTHVSYETDAKKNARAEAFATIARLWPDTAEDFIAKRNEE